MIGRILAALCIAGAAVALGAACAGPVPAGAPEPGGLSVVTRIPRLSQEPTPTATARPPRTLPANTVAVDINDSFFQPGVVTVTVGMTVRWYHEGGLTHNTRALDGAWTACGGWFVLDAIEALARGPGR